MFKNTLRANPELWWWAMFGSKMIRLPKTSIFWEKSLILFSPTYWPISLCKILKNSYIRPRVMRLCHFWTQNGPICPNEIVWEKDLLINIASSIMHIYILKIKVKHQSINEILTIKEYCAIFGPNLRSRLAPPPPHPHACSFRRMLKDHKNFHFTTIPDKTNDSIF